MAPTNEGYSRDCCLTMQWMLPVPVLPDETLSSWLTRAALAQGCDPLVLTGSIWPGWRAWTMDIDRGLGDQQLSELPPVSGIPAGTFKAMSLRREAEVIAGGDLEVSRSWPWILALGSKNRRRQSGLQYCPDCLQTDSKPYFRRKWRFAWQSGCETHQVRLVSHCDRCCSPVQPHRLTAESILLSKCPICGFNLARAIRYPISTGSKIFQAASNNVIHSRHAFYDSQAFAPHNWFAIARFFTGVVRQALRQPSSQLAGALRRLEVLSGIDNAPLLGLPLELLLPLERDFLFNQAYRLMLVGRSDLLQALLDAGVTANCLRSNSESIPPGLSELFINLSTNDKRARSSRSILPRTRSRRSVLMAWARLQRKMGP